MQEKETIEKTVKYTNKNSLIERINELDKYVVVENNQFKLKIPKGIIIDPEILILAEKQILLSN